MDAPTKRLVRIAAALLLTALSMVSIDVGWRHPLAALWAAGGLLALGWPILILLAAARYWPTRRGAESFGLALLCMGPLVPIVIGRGGAIFELWGLSLASFVIVPVVGTLVVRTIAAHVRAEGAPFVIATLVLVVPTAAMLWAEGVLVSIREGMEPMHLQLLVFAWAVCFGLAVPLTLLLTLQRPARNWIVWVTGGVGLSTAGAFSYVDHVSMVGLYPAVHAWLEWMAGLASTVGLGVLGFWVEPRLGKKARIGVLGTSLVAVGSFALAGPVDDLLFRAALARGPVGRALLQLRPRSASGAEMVRDPRLDFERAHENASAIADADIVLITVDTLRADELAHMPNVSALAAESVVFERAYAPAPATYLSLPAILAGRSTGELDWRLRLVPPGDEPPIPIEQATREQRLRYDFFVLADPPRGGALPLRLQAAGLHTLAVVDGGVSEFLRPNTGFSLGFDRYESMAGGVRWPTSERHVRRALAMRAEASGRSFLWVHLFDPHRAEREREAYGPLVRETDRAIGTLLDELRKSPRWNRTVIAITADHGEAFGEHLARGHGSSLYDEQVRVPLIVRVPGAPPGVVSEPVSAIDVAPTLASLAGVELTGMTGVDLAPLVMGDAEAYPAQRPIFAEHLHYGPNTKKRLADLKMVVLGEHKLIWDRRAESVELYDLAEDPGEMRSILWEQPDSARSLQALLRAWSDAVEREHPLP